MNLTHNYYGLECKVLIESTFVSQDKVNDLESKYPDFEIIEIGHQSDHGYKFRYAAFKKGSYDSFFRKEEEFYS